MASREARRHGRAGRALATEKFDINRLNDRLVTILERVLREEPVD